MKMLDLIHRWTGGFIGLLLAILGLSGALLVHKDAWLHATLPHASDAYIADNAVLARAVAKVADAPATLPDGMLLASNSLGVHRISYGEGNAAYMDQAGNIVTRWSGHSGRFETWLFDLHHHFLTGDTGETIAGIAGLAGLGFVITGILLWWRTRKTFEFRIWPKRMSRPAIVRHHRDLGVVMAPLLFLSMLTGVMMIFLPFSAMILSPFSPPAQMQAAMKPPVIQGGALAIYGAENWQKLFDEAHRRFPTAQPRIIVFPDKPGGLITMRLKQPEEWLPNGRTVIWFDPANGRVIDARNALTLPKGLRIFNMAYPVHAAKVGGLPYRLVMTLSGLTLAMLGGFAVFTFWTQKGQERAKKRRIKAMRPSTT